MRKPGYKTTEFWITNVVILLGAILASGALAEGGLAAQVIGGIIAAAAKLGYDANRAATKKAELFKEAKALEAGAKAPPDPS
jgi:hypothetical protein